MGRIEVFETETALIDSIAEKKAEGLKEAQMTVIANSSLHKTVSEFKDIGNKAADLGPLAKLFSLFSTTSREEKLMDELDLTDDEKKIHRKSLEDNKLLLYIE
ncbi:MAG TPA: hypothetical protein VK105_13475 [Virgibacillus sp.]|nr:hypothetical protein [Virgibacillus sp.]HLR68117.1 hypothetical protein [Virgibacillus sp.]